MRSELSISLAVWFERVQLSLQLVRRVHMRMQLRSAQRPGFLLSEHRTHALTWSKCAAELDSSLIIDSSPSMPCHVMRLELARLCMLGL